MKKSIIVIMSILWTLQNLYAQKLTGVYSKDLPEVVINKDVSLHILSPEPIQYVDISTHAIAGDLPLKNVLRMKILADSTNLIKKLGERLGIVTVVGESFIAQYALRYVDNSVYTFPTQINILPENMQPLDVPGISLTSKEIQDFSIRMLEKPEHRSLRKANGFGMEARLNQIYGVGDYIFLDITYLNHTKLPFKVDEQRYKIEDKKISKATNVQSVEIKPIWQLYSTDTIKRRYRNIYVLKKATFPGNKVLRIELTEKQISGRVLTLQMKYSDILNAESL